MQAMMVSGDGKWSVLTSTGSSYALRDGRARREVITQPSHSELKSLIEIEAYHFCMRTVNNAQLLQDRAWKSALDRKHENDVEMVHSNKECKWSVLTQEQNAQ
jgi:hypothetical protein